VLISEQNCASPPNSPTASPIIERGEIRYEGTPSELAAHRGARKVPDGLVADDAAVPQFWHGLDLVR
jgi:hypothetical protein